MTTINGHRLTEAQVHTLDLALDYMRKHSGDTAWSSNTSPAGNGRWISPREIFPHRNNQNTAHVRTLRRLWDMGILRACEIEVSKGGAVPFGMMRGRSIAAQGEV